MRNLTECLRRNTWLLMTAFLAFVSSAVVGYLTVDAESTTPAIWLATMWAMLGFGALIILLVLIECLAALSDND